MRITVNCYGRNLASSLGMPWWIWAIQTLCTSSPNFSDCSFSILLWWSWNGKSQTALQSFGHTWPFSGAENARVLNMSNMSFAALFFTSLYNSTYFCVIPKVQFFYHLGYFKKYIFTLVLQVIDFPLVVFVWCSFFKKNKKICLPFNAYSFIVLQCFSCKFKKKNSTAVLSGVVCFPVVLSGW